MDEPREEEGEEEEFVELDLEKTLTWTGNAVSIQAGGEFRLPLIVPHPSVLAIQVRSRPQHRPRAIPNPIRRPRSLVCVPAV
jgi:hypothetical protein